MICQTVAYVKSELKRYVDTAHDSDRLHVQVCEAGVFRVVPSVVVLFKALRSDGTTRYPCQNGKAIIKLAEVPAAIVHMNDLVGNQFPYADFAAGAALVPVEKHILSVISISRHATQPGQFVDEFLCATEHVNIGISRKSGAQAEQDQFPGELFMVGDVQAHPQSHELVSELVAKSCQQSDWGPKSGARSLTPCTK